MEIPVPEYVARILDALEDAGAESYAVGGCVRDALLGREPHDWDVCTAATPDRVEAVFAGRRVLETGLKHGTVTVLTEGGSVEITTFRRESAYSDGRHPDAVTFVPRVEEDLGRRDFTVNAMAYSPRRGLRDDYGGQADLAAGILRCVGDPDARFREDALRILRAMRFAARYGFTVEADTARAMAENRALLKNVSPERCFTELKGILCAPAPGAVLLAFPQVIFAVLPPLAPMLGFDQHVPAHLWDVWGHTCRAVDAVEPDPILRLAMLFHDCGKPAVFTLDPETGRGHFHGHPAVGAEMADSMLRSLRCDTATREAVVTLVRHHDDRQDGSPRAVRRLLSKIGAENMRRLHSVRLADAEAHAPEIRERMLARAEEDQAVARTLLEREGVLTVSALAIGGRELAALGMAPGPEMGRLLRALLEEVINETLPNTAEALTDRAAALILQQKLKEEKDHG